MCKINDGQRLAEAASYLTPEPASVLSEHIGELYDAQEIRLRLNKPFEIRFPGGAYYITKSGSLSLNRLGDNLMCTLRELESTFQKICGFSVYARQNELNRGFITLKGGHRAGVCGTAVIENGKIVNIRHITSINIRIAREYKNCASALLRDADVSGGLLICGAPCSGKTTLLRDIARQISNIENKNVVLIDERGELAGKSGSGFHNDVGMCDVFDGYAKPAAILHAVRSMSPDLIICDEIGSDDDVKALALCKNSGVNVIATVHASNKADLMTKKQIMSVIKTGVFPSIVFLSGRNRAGRIAEIIKGEDLYDAS